jgi:hypothetical protein
LTVGVSATLGGRLQPHTPASVFDGTNFVRPASGTSYLRTGQCFECTYLEDGSPVCPMIGRRKELLKLNGLLQKGPVPRAALGIGACLAAADSTGSRKIGKGEAAIYVCDEIVGKGSADMYTHWEGFILIGATNDGGPGSDVTAIKFAAVGLECKAKLYMGSLAFPTSHLPADIGPPNLYTALNDLSSTYVEEKVALERLEVPCLPDPFVATADRGEFKFEEALAGLEAAKTAAKATRLRATGECFACTWSSYYTTLKCALTDVQKATRRAALGFDEPHEDEQSVEDDDYDRLDAVITLAAEKANIFTMGTASWTVCDERTYMDDAGQRRILGAVLCGVEEPSRLRKCLRFYASYDLVVDDSWKISLGWMSSWSREEMLRKHSVAQAAYEDWQRYKGGDTSGFSYGTTAMTLEIAYKAANTEYNAQVSGSGTDLANRQKAKEAIKWSAMSPAAAADKAYIYLFDRSLAAKDYVTNRYISPRPCNEAPNGVAV